MTRRAALVVALLASCATDRPPAPAESREWTRLHAPWRDPEPVPPVAVHFADPVAARYHMRAHFADLRGVEQRLLAGKLDEALTLAYLLTQRTDDPAMAPWDDRSQRVLDAATELTKATGLDEALRREARVAVACAQCHVAAEARPAFAAAPPLPLNRLTAEARMTRHVWAADRLWEGLVAADETRWSRGLAVLADSPVPFTAMTDAPALAADLQKRARAQLDGRGTTMLEERGAAYGEILVVCAACHATLHADAR